MTAPHNAGLFFCAERSQKRLYSRSPDTQPCPPRRREKRGYRTAVMPVSFRTFCVNPVLMLCWDIERGGQRKSRKRARKGRKKHKDLRISKKSCKFARFLYSNTKYETGTGYNKT